MDFFKPSWKKIYWLLLVYLVSEIYSSVVMPTAPSSLMANFVSFVLNPASLVLTQASGMEKEIILPFAKTLDLFWLYLIATILAKEISKDKE
jgi:hypothetical protein